MAELATTMITVGFGSQLGPLSAEFTSAELMEYIVKAGLVNVEEQLAEMAIGIRHQFDLAGVALAMGSAGLSSEIKIANPLERSIVADLSVAAMGGVVRGRIDVENLAIQLISDSARYAVQQSYANSSSDEYHQSQRASRGEGPITQTTIEQQWESQLINDAEFTANRQLPSVTFDVNNSYVSQQLGQRVGEEVSHFYHPTPPPRNPSGFWRGVDDVLKMQEGTRKFADLFFTGHYEAPRDSWERAGFVIGAPIALSLGAERLGAEAINTLYQGSQQLGKGLMQASRLMNRWGLFGHNGVEESTLTHLSPTELEITQPRTMGRKAFARLVENIKENGINETVKYIKYNGKNYVVDGNHRLVAARTLGLNEIPVEKVELPYLGYRTTDDLNFYSPGFSNN